MCNDTDGNAIYFTRLGDRLTEIPEPNGEQPRAKVMKRIEAPTGFVDIDKRTFGLASGDLAIVTGGPSAGKTSFAYNVAINAAYRDTKALLVALGSSAENTAVQICAAEGGLDIRRLLVGDITHEEWSHLSEISAGLRERELFICDDARITLDGLHRLVMDFVEGVDKSLVVIDESDLIISPDNGQTPDWPCSQASLALYLKKLARIANTSILVTMDSAPYSLSRERYLGDMTEILPEGAIQIADLILHINRHSGDSQDTLFAPLAEILIAKSRSCAPMCIKLAFSSACMRFINFAEFSE